MYRVHAYFPLRQRQVTFRWPLQRYIKALAFLREPRLQFVTLTQPQSQSQHATSTACLPDAVGTETLIRACLSNMTFRPRHGVAQLTTSQSPWNLKLHPRFLVLVCLSFQKPNADIVPASKMKHHIFPPQTTSHTRQRQDHKTKRFTTTPTP